MADIELKKPFDYREYGGTVNDLGDSYVTEIAWLLENINALRANKKSPSSQTVGTTNHQFYIDDDDNVHIISKTGIDTVVGRVEGNFGITSGTGMVVVSKTEPKDGSVWIKPK